MLLSSKGKHRRPSKAVRIATLVASPVPQSPFR